MHIAEVVTIAKSLPLLRLNTYKSLILSYSADYRRILPKNNGGTNRGPAVIFRLFRQARCAMSHSAICTAFSAAPLRI